MIELQTLDNQLRHFLDTYTLFTDEQGRHNPVWNLFDAFIHLNTNMHYIEVEIIEEFVSLLWRFFPNENIRVQAFYEYRLEFPHTYSRIVNTTFPIRASLFPHNCTYLHAVEQLILICLTD